MIGIDAAYLSRLFKDSNKLDLSLLHKLINNIVITLGRHLKWIEDRKDVMEEFCSD